MDIQNEIVKINEKLDRLLVQQAELKELIAGSAPVPESDTSGDDPDA